MTPLAQTIRSIYQSLEEGKVARVIGLLHEQIVVHQASSLPYGGTFYGREGFISSYSMILSTWALYRKVPAQFLSDEENVVVLGEVTLKAKRGGVELVLPFVDQWTLQQGAVRQLRKFEWDTAHLLTYLNPPGSITLTGIDGL